MTTSRFERAILLITALAGCSLADGQRADSCPPLPLSSELQIYMRDDEEGRQVADCLTENAVNLSSADDPSEQIAQATVAACEASLGLAEVEANIRRFERGDLSNAGADDVRREAQRYALTRVVQARAGQCNSADQK